MKKIILPCLVLVLSACTAVKVQPLDRNLNVRHVCIENNPKVIVTEFIPVLEEGFKRNGISTRVFDGPAPENCEYVLKYTALRTWDVVPYLSHAELRLLRDGREIASAQYHLRGRGGLAPVKWDSTKSKMDPVIDRLLQR